MWDWSELKKVSVRVGHFSLKRPTKNWDWDFYKSRSIFRRRLRHRKFHLLKKMIKFWNFIFERLGREKKTSTGGVLKHLNFNSNFNRAKILVLLLKFKNIDSKALNKEILLNFDPKTRSFPFVFHLVWLKFAKYPWNFLVWLRSRYHPPSG